MIRVGCTLAGLLAFDLAIAQPAPPPPTEADRLFEEGRLLAKDGKYAEACARFERSFEIDHALGTELNLADCQEKLGHLRLAWRLFLAAADESERSDDTKRTEFARSRANALAAQLTEVVVNVATPAAEGLAITIAGHPLEVAPVVRDRTEPGDIEVVATMPNRAPFRTTVRGIAGTSVSVDVPPLLQGVVKAPPPVVTSQRRPGRVRLAIGLGIGAGGATVAATIFAYKGRSNYNAAVDGEHCQTVSAGVYCDPTGDAAIADAQRLADVGTVLAIGAGALLATAVVVYVTAPRDRVTVTPVAGGEHVGLVVRGAF